MFPFQGFTCSRGNTDLKRNSLNRVREFTVDGSHVTMDEAVRKVVKEIKARKPTEVIHVEYDGNQGLLTWYFPARLWNAIHSATTDYSICSLEGHMAISKVYGSSFGATPEDFSKADSFVVWGSDPKTNFIHGWKLMKGKYIATIDVRMSSTAKESDRAFIIRPSSDAFLAIGVLKSLHEMGYGEEIHTPWEVIEEETGVGRDEVEELASIYVEKRPLTIIGFALGRTFQGGKAISMISMIPSLLGIKRGFYYSNSSYGINFSYLRGTSKPSRVVGMADLYREVERGSITFMFVWNSNPLHSLPGSDRIVEAVEEGRLFLVVHDPFVSETAKVANVLMPAPTYLEKEDVVYSYWHRYLVYNKPVLPKLGVDEVTLMRAIAKEMGLNDESVWEDPWVAVEKATGVDIVELKSKGMVKLPEPEPAEPRFKIPTLERTPKGKVLVFGSHPNFTNSQFKEIYGRKEAFAFNSSLDGVGYLKSKWGKIRVRFVKTDDVPEGVIFMFKNNLFDLDGKPVNSIIGNEKGESGTPMLNFTLVETEMNGEKNF